MNFTLAYCRYHNEQGIRPVKDQFIRQRAKVPSMIQTGRKHGMQLLDDAIMQLYNKGWISADEAYQKCNDKDTFKPFLKSYPTDFTEA